MEPLVSICCITYNHEKYISNAIDSFMIQETDFPFEILIHDDASTDNTPAIIKQYETKYPEIIKPIYQRENQQSKGKNPLNDYVLPKVKGKYVATCEGDDYWTDSRKLHKQVAFMESNSDYVMCFHAVKVIDIDKRFLGRFMGPYGNGSKEYTIQDTVKSGFVHVSSRVMRTEVYKTDRPKFLKHAMHGDYALALYMSAEGKVYFIDEVMSAYRKGVENSMMTNYKKNLSAEKEIKYHKNRIETLKKADEYYEYRYNKEIESVNLTSQLILVLLEKKHSFSNKTIIKRYINQNGIISFIKLFLIKKYPSIGKKMAKIKDKIYLKSMKGIKG